MKFNKYHLFEVHIFHWWQLQQLLSPGTKNPSYATAVIPFIAFLICSSFPLKSWISFFMSLTS
jgi:hypothetical protein